MHVFFPLIAVLIWSLNVIVNKLSVGIIDPVAIAFYRWLLALVVLTPFMLPGVRRHWRTIAQHWGKLLLLGFLGMMLYQSMAYYAAHTISALMMGILTSLIPLLTVLISIPLLRITPTVGLLCGGVLSFFGIAWLISGGHPAQILAHGIGQGEIMMFIAASAYALYGVLTKRWSLPLPTWVSLYVQIAFGVLLLLPTLLLANSIVLTPHSLPLVLFAGLFASILAPWMWIVGVMRIGANSASIFINLTPVFTAIVAITFLNEPLHAYHIVGGVLTLLGVVLAQRLQTPLYQRKAKAAQQQTMPESTKAE